MEHEAKTKMARASMVAKLFMRSYEKAGKSTEKDLYMAFIASANSCSAQLSNTIWNITFLPQGKQNDRELAIDCEAFAKYFADRILFCQNLLVVVDTVMERKDPCPSSGPILDLSATSPKRMSTESWQL